MVEPSFEDSGGPLGRRERPPARAGLQRGDGRRGRPARLGLRPDRPPSTGAGSASRRPTARSRTSSPRCASSRARRPRRRGCEGMAANDARTYANNNAIVEAVGRGEIPFGLVNHYYNHRFLAEDPGLPSRNHQFDDGDIGGLVIPASASVLARVGQAGGRAGASSSSCCRRRRRSTSPRRRSSTRSPTACRRPRASRRCRSLRPPAGEDAGRSSATSRAPAS